MNQQSQLRTTPDTNLAHLERTLTRQLFSETHPLRAVFGDFSSEVFVGVNTDAAIVAVNPRWSSTDFGIFQIPSLGTIQNQRISRDNPTGIFANWCLSMADNDGTRTAFVPPETGRAILLPPAPHPIFRDVLVKGTGLVEKYTNNNKLRFASRGFNGYLEISEAERDLVNTEILTRAGILVVAGLGVINHKHVVQHDGFTEWSANYIRAFRVQTRISNLFELDTSTMKAAIDDAIRRMNLLFPQLSIRSYTDYFREMIEICARNVAIMQAIGFTQDSFHYGQVTLGGEIADLGIGSFQKPTERGVVNTLHPWFRFERQPILMLNMLYKTHAVKAEPEPIRLQAGCRALNEQQTLFGAISRFAPEAAAEIHEMQPEKVFWEVYERTYRSFDSAAFKQEVISQLPQYYHWTPENMLQQVQNDHREYVRIAYQELLQELLKHYDGQKGPWQQFGPTSIHKQTIFATAARLVNPDLELDFSNEPVGFSSGDDKTYITPFNPEEDLSWKPSLISS